NAMMQFVIRLWIKMILMTTAYTWIGRTLRRRRRGKTRAARQHIEKPASCQSGKSGSIRNAKHTKSDVRPAKKAQKARSCDGNVKSALRTFPQCGPVFLFL